MERAEIVKQFPPLQAVYFTISEIEKMRDRSVLVFRIGFLAVVDSDHYVQYILMYHLNLIIFYLPAIFFLIYVLSLESAIMNHLYC